MPEKQLSQIEEFSKLIAESTPEDRIDKTYIYTRLRNSFSPQEIIELLVSYIEERSYPSNEAAEDMFDSIFETASKEIPYDEAYSRDLLIKELAPFYDKVGEIALHLSMGFATLELAGFVIRKIDFSNDFINQIKSLAFDHVGNAQNSFWILGVFGLYKLNEKLLSQVRIKVPDVFFLRKSLEYLLEIGKILMPYLMIAVMLGYQIDAETAQILPGSFGTADITDLPVGLISIIGLAKAFEMQKYKRPFFRPLQDKISKAQSQTKKLLPLLLFFNIGGFTVPGHAANLMGKELLQESQPMTRNPVSIIKDAFRHLFHGEVKNHAETTSQAVE